jgi:hypothetical protein
MANAIRSNIPVYQQTDPKFFPDYEYREYPKMMTDENGDPIIRNPVHATTDDGRQVMRNGKPHIIGGEYVTVANPEEEAEFLKIHPECAKKVSIPIHADAVMQDLENENARLRKLLLENEELNDKVAAKPTKKPGRPKAEKALTLEQFASAK